MYDELIEMLEEILKQDKLFELGAKGIKKSIIALQNEGLSRTEAVQIVAEQGSIVKGNR